MFNLGEAILALLEIVFGFWNNQVSLVFELLGQSPTGFKGGGPWGIIEGIEPLFVGIGSALVVLFFVIGFCAESVDIREEIRFEAILRMFIRVAIAQWLVSYNITIMKALFTSCGNLVGHLGQNQSVELSIDPAQAEVIKDLGFGTSIVFLILAVFLSLIVIICGFFLLYNVYFRFLKIMVIVPFGAIASSTLAGNRGLSNTFVAYMKYFISVVFEAVTMALAILLCNQFISSGLPTFTGDYEDWAKTLIYLGEMTFTVALTVGTVKGAQNLTSRARPDAKKDKAEPGISHYMSGARGMLPTVFDIEPPGKNSRIHQAEKPVELLQQILGFVTEEKEWVLDQFAGSFSLGEAALSSERNAICIEINEEYFEKGKERLLSAKSRSR